MELKVEDIKTVIEEILEGNLGKDLLPQIKWNSFSLKTDGNDEKTILKMYAMAHEKRRYISHMEKLSSGRVVMTTMPYQVALDNLWRRCNARVRVGNKKVLDDLQAGLGDGDYGGDILNDDITRMYPHRVEDIMLPEE